MPRVSHFYATLSRQAVSTLAARHNGAIARSLKTSCIKAAVAHPVTTHGPPPKAPSPAPFFDACSGLRSESPFEKEANARPEKPSSGLKKRFWKDVIVRKKSEGNYEVLLDTRPIRTPSKDALSIPSTKPYLAHAIALEWDVMTTAQQALKNHLIPLTSLTARAADIAREDEEGMSSARDQIVKTAMRYLDTDTLLCWVPEAADSLGETNENGEKVESLREAQMRVANDTIAFLGTKVWPGVDIRPILDADSILPVSQPQVTKDIIQQWVMNLHAFDLAALERGILAAKSLLIAVRLVAEWSENFRGLQRPGQKRFGIEEAAEASSMEVKWQTDMWGEVEDTHDVDKEDLRRQLGSVIVVVSGETR
ncbi:ATP12-domain-containing protein [Aspergillus uvarum CBS 121591]|uniref:ATP12-domain-containing protein n=1 Tax=Aspergillus uvarum CBS 121591 TaxID=1448315 RepID=A0A319CN89_9EURO|nr:ATP12-domain-containing protein [Aspergillus uvarum CBS 121591]PYH86966.1 ATP12-domain-containing protein [Aspergillus uvarum CBS 121591]